MGWMGRSGYRDRMGLEMGWGGSGYGMNIEMRCRQGWDEIGDGMGMGIGMGTGRERDGDGNGDEDGVGIGWR